MGKGLTLEDCLGAGAMEDASPDEGGAGAARAAVAGAAEAGVDLAGTGADFRDGPRPPAAADLVRRG